MQETLNQDYAENRQGERRNTERRSRERRNLLTTNWPFTMAEQLTHTVALVHMVFALLAIGHAQFVWFEPTSIAARTLLPLGDIANWVVLAQTVFGILLILQACSHKLRGWTCAHMTWYGLAVCIMMRLGGEFIQEDRSWVMVGYTAATMALALWGALIAAKTR